MKVHPTQLEFTALVAEVPDSSMEAKAAKRARARAFARLRREEQAAERRREEKLVEMLIQLGLTHHVHGEPGKSIPPLLRVLELDPSQVFVREFLVRDYIRMEDYGAAKDCIIDALRDTPETGWAYVGLAICYREADSDPQKAEQFLNRALEIDPYDAQALEHLGSLCLAEERFEDALGHFNRVGLLHPGRIYAHYGRIMSHLGLNSLSEAESALERLAQQADPATPEDAHLLAAAEAAVLAAKERSF